MPEDIRALVAYLRSVPAVASSEPGDAGCRRPLNSPKERLAPRMRGGNSWSSRAPVVS